MSVSCNNNTVSKTDVIAMMSLNGKIAMVTGGSQNFGEEIATGLAEAGAKVIITSRDSAKVRQIAVKMNKAYPGMIIPKIMDLLDEQSIIKLFAEINKEFGRLDVLVNNAGGHSNEACGFLERETLAGWNAFIDTNLTGTFLMIREYSKLMIPHKSGSIINISSVSSLVGRDRSVYTQGMTPNPVAYTAAKAGVTGLTYDAAAYLGAFGIRVNAISPGGFERTQPKEFIGEYSRRTMLGRMGKEGQDLKGAVVFLASDAAGYITGHNLYVDGGFTRFK